MAMGVNLEIKKPAWPRSSKGFHWAPVVGLIPHTGANIKSKAVPLHALVALGGEEV
jgi:hypothetical protein